MPRLCLAHHFVCPTAYNHPTLVVRIAGYCAYFDDLADDLKREVIDRTYYSSAT